MALAVLAQNEFKMDFLKEWFMAYSLAAEQNFLEWQHPRPTHSKAATAEQSQHGNIPFVQADVPQKKLTILK